MAGDKFPIYPEDLIPATGSLPLHVIRDLHDIASIEVARIEELSAALSQELDLLTEETLEHIVARHIADESQTSAAVNVLNNMRAENVEQVILFVNAWRNASANNKKRFSNEAFSSLKTKLQLLVQDYPAIERMRKAIRLRKALGNSLEEVELICDARPVFDEQRERILGMLVLTTMKLQYERQNGETEEVEVMLSPQQVESLIEKAQAAMHKSQIMTMTFDR